MRLESGGFQQLRRDCRLRLEPADVGGCFAGI